MENLAGTVGEEEGMRAAAVVTGASNGIGREIALLAARELPVVLVARSADRLEALAAEIAASGGESHPLPLALGAEPAAGTIAEFLRARRLFCDVLVNNAGYGLVGDATRLDPADQLGIVDLNVRALAELTLAFLPAMRRRRRGGILNVASVAGFLPGPLMAVYYASKAFVRSFSLALWEECRGDGVTVTALCPGPVETGFAARATGVKTAPRRSQVMPNGDARSVAAEGWRAFRAGRRIVVPGLANKLLTFLAPIAPERLVLLGVRRLQKRRLNQDGA